MTESTVAVILLVVCLTGLALFYVHRKRGSFSFRKWRTGAVINGKNYSKGTSISYGKGLWQIEVPTDPRRHAHSIINHRPGNMLDDATWLRMVIEIEGGPFVPQEFPDRPALISMMFQREGDDWSAKGEYNFYRWWSRSTLPMIPGVHTMTVPMVYTDWTSVMGGAMNAERFAAAIRFCDNVSVNFGTNGGRSHGVWASGPNKVTLHEFGTL